mmetsp:Transcript_5916/g.8821  ORF Transcript_5916/g.8821 Transcript_5916/m.8821 type:complete len:256 (-) Transcript_5916:2167-2934(-)
MFDLFDWKNAPFSPFSFPLSVSSIYVLVVLVHSQFPSVQKLVVLTNVKVLVKYHNLILMLASFLMFSGCLYEVINRSLKEDSITWLFCEHQSTTAKGSLWFYVYLYYLSKYYELLDTILQMASGKIPPNYFLHVYHHSIVILNTWFWLESAASMQFIGVLFNTAVHVVMYYYYYLRSIGIVPKWKNFVTTFQIVQFITSALSFLITLSLVLLRRNGDLNDQCKGMEVVIGSMLFNMSLLYGFTGILSKGMVRKER